MTLTNRLNLFFLGTLAVVLIGFSVALYVLAEQHLIRQLDDQLGAATRTLASAAEVDPDGVEWEPHNRPHTLAPGVFGDSLHWSVTAEDGRVVDRSPQSEAESLLASADEPFRTGHRNPRRLDHDGQAWQVTRLRLEPDHPLSGKPEQPKHRALTLTVAVPLDPVHAILRTLAATLIGLSLAVFAIAAVAGRLVCRRALAPVARMAEAAQSMGASDLAERLPTTPFRDELTGLATAFNGLLGRLEEAFERERRFAGEASHQLRTPIAAMMGQVEVALRRDRDPDEYRRVLRTIQDQAGRLRRVVEALLFLARSQHEAVFPGRERLDLVVWVPARLESWHGHARALDLRFEANGVNELWTSSHPDLLGELLDSLLDNALKYSEADTSVSIRVGRELAGIWVEIEDRGVGIAVDELPHLFRPFFRSAAARQRGVPGVGLGLAVAARIATALGGSLHVESSLGNGSCFRLNLPAWMDREEHPKPEASAPLVIR